MTTLFIAEVSSNHAQDLERCFKFIDTAARMGCDAVKFQLFKVNDLFIPAVLQCSLDHRKRKTWELPLEFLAPLFQRCKENNILFCCTPFYLEAVEQLFPFVAFYKISSYELLWDDLLIACAKTRKPVILSTGMATLEEVEHAVNVLKRANCRDITLLHCLSTYPAPIAEVNLRAIQTLRHATGVKVGWSDHSVEPAIIYRAVHAYGAEVVEFHLDLEGSGAEFVSGHCWLPEAMQEVIATINKGFLADGQSIKAPAPSEQSERCWRADPSDGLRPLREIRESLP